MKDFLAKVLKYPIKIFNIIYSKNFYGKRKKYLQKDIESDIPSNKNICVISPHVDDETIGLGAAMINMVNRGCNVDIIYVTDSSAFSLKIEKNELKELRRLEALKIKDIIGIREILTLNVEDGKDFTYPFKAQENLEKIFSEKNYDIIYAPFLIDAHNKHLISTKLTVEAMKNINFKNELILYETNIPINEKLINVIYPMDREVFAKKTKLYNAFETQKISYDFDVYELLSKVRKNYLKGSYAVEVCVKMDYKNALSFIDFQKTSKYNPLIFPRTGNHRVLYKQFFKMPAEKYFYDDILYDILNKNKNKA